MNYKQLTAALQQLYIKYASSDDDITVDFAAIAQQFADSELRSSEDGRNYDEYADCIYEHLIAAGSNSSPIHVARRIADCLINEAE